MRATADTDNNRLVVFSVAKGAFLRVLRTAVPFEQPDDCAIIGNGAIVVAEFVGRRLLPGRTPATTRRLATTEAWREASATRLRPEKSAARTC